MFCVCLTPILYCFSYNVPVIIRFLGVISGTCTNRTNPLFVSKMWLDHVKRGTGRGRGAKERCPPGLLTTTFYTNTRIIENHDVTCAKWGREAGENSLKVSKKPRVCSMSYRSIITTSESNKNTYCLHDVNMYYFYDEENMRFGSWQQKAAPPTPSSHGSTGYCTMDHYQGHWKRDPTDTNGLSNCKNTFNEISQKKTLGQSVLGILLVGKDALCEEVICWDMFWEFSNKSKLNTSSKQLRFYHKRQSCCKLKTINNDS